MSSRIFNSVFAGIGPYPGSGIEFFVPLFQKGCVCLDVSRRFFIPRSPHGEHDQQIGRYIAFWNKGVAFVSHGGEVAGQFAFLPLPGNVGKKFPDIITGRLGTFGKMFPAPGTAAAVAAVIGHDVEKRKSGITGVGPGADPPAGGRLLFKEGFGIFEDDLFYTA